MDKKKEWALIQNMITGDFNPNHDPDDGRFTSGSGGPTISGKPRNPDAEYNKKVINSLKRELDGGKKVVVAAFEDFSGTTADFIKQAEEAGLEVKDKNGNAVWLKKAESKSSGKKDISKMTDKELRAAISESDHISRNENWSKMSKAEKAASQERRNRSHEMRKELDRRGAAAEKAHGIKGGFENAKKKTSDATWSLTERMMMGDFNPNHDDLGRFTTGSGGSSWKPDDIYNAEGFVGHRYIENQAEEFLETHLADNGEELDQIFESRVVGKPDESGRADVEVDYRVVTESGKLEERTSTVNALVTSGKMKGESLKAAAEDPLHESAANVSKILEEYQELNKRKRDVDGSFIKPDGTKISEAEHGSEVKALMKRYQSEVDKQRKLGVGPTGSMDPEVNKHFKSETKAAVKASETSTHGKIVDQGGGQWYGENDDGSSVSILDGGKEDYNLWKYGSRQIYEVQPVDKDLNWGKKEYYGKKSEAMAAAKAHLKRMSGK